MRRGGGPIHHGAPIPTTLGFAFPACVTEALIQVSKHVRLSSHGRSRPALTKNNDLQLLIDNEIFCLTADRKGSRLSQLQEFTLINHLAHFFTERDEMNKYAYFEVLFLGREGESHVHEHRLRILYRLASYALQFPVLQLYAQISLWLSKVGNSKPYAEELVAVLAEHYLKPSDSKILSKSDILEAVLSLLLRTVTLIDSLPEFTVFFVGMLFDPELRWSRFRCDALCIIGSKSPAACRNEAEKGCPNIPSSLSRLISDAQARTLVSVPVQ
ncbi:hypothetical protein COOONC_15380 [Cooperia oncophora]